MPPIKRRPRGEGGLRRRADGYWVATIELGVDPLTGRRGRRGIVRRRQEDVLREKRALERQRDDYGTVPAAGITVGMWLDMWVEDVAQLKPNTRRSYRSTIRTYIAPTIGHVPLAKLTPDHVRRMTGAAAERGLSPSTVHRAYAVLSSALTSAVEDGKLASSPTRRMRAPRVPEDDTLVLSVEQSKGFMQHVWHDPLGMRWALALLTGMRQGEILGLEWSRVSAQRIDLSWQLQRLGFRHGCGGTCHVRRPGSCPQRELDVRPDDEYQQVLGGLCLIRPKSAAGRRIIPAIPAIAGILAEQRRRQQAAGIASRFVFTRPDGSPIDPSLDSAAWHAALGSARLPQTKLHAARHTAATLLLEAGVDGKVVQQIVGHSTVAMSRRYQHVSTALAGDALGAVAELIGLGAIQAPATPAAIE